MFRICYSLYTRNSEYANTISARYYKDGSEILIDQSELDKNHYTAACKRIDLETRQLSLLQ